MMKADPIMCGTQRADSPAPAMPKHGVTVEKLSGQIKTESICRDQHKMKRHKRMTVDCLP